MKSQRRVLCDWGSSRLRAFLDVDGIIVDRREGPGISALNMPPHLALREAVDLWHAAEGFDQVVMCGMVGSRNGLIEVPYVPAPVGSRAWTDHSVSHRAGELDLTIAPGVRGLNYSDAPDVMRGEETQIFGAFQCDPALMQGHRLLLLPGTHSKWVDVRDGHISRFHTFITGEVFALLRDYSSLLRAGDSEGESEAGFAAGLERGGKAGVAESLFEARSAQLLLGRTLGWGRGFLSGVLIGNEVATILRARRIHGPVTLIGEPKLSALYRRALAANEIDTTELDGDLCVIAGLRLLTTHSERVN